MNASLVPRLITRLKTFVAVEIYRRGEDQQWVPVPERCTLSLEQQHDAWVAETRNETRLVSSPTIGYTMEGEYLRTTTAVAVIYVRPVEELYERGPGDATRALPG